MKFCYRRMHPKNTRIHTFYTKAGFSVNYFVQIDVVNNIGTILVGTSDGVEFFEEKNLGQIKFDGNKWVLLNFIRPDDD